MMKKKFKEECYTRIFLFTELNMLKPKLLTTLQDYNKQKFIADLTSGVIVGIAALPLAIAFGIASGVAPQQGIITAIIAGIESLLSAIVADGMIGGKHRSNMELIAQGVANLITPLFGEIPAIGAIARTATNIKNSGCAISSCLSYE